MVEGGRFPGCGSVATTAVGTELTVMSVILFMAGITISRCAFEDVIGMTTHAGCRCVCTG
jgi:hypothetical protein